jgi:hypothetical protein
MSSRLVLHWLKTVVCVSSSDLAPVVVADFGPG